MANLAEEYRPVYKEILTTLQKKYNYMTEVCRLTGEIEEALKRDDRISTQMLLAMRQEELDGIKKCDKDLHLLIESTPEVLRQWLEKAVNGTIPQSDEYGTEENMVLRISANIRSEWEKAVRIDRHVNRKLAGEESFYHDQKDGE